MWNIPWVETIVYPVAAVEPHVRDITIDPTDHKTMYVALQVGYMLKTTDGGKNWQLFNATSTATCTPSCFIRKTPSKSLSPPAATTAAPATRKAERFTRSDDGGRAGSRWHRSSEKNIRFRWRSIRRSPM